MAEYGDPDTGEWELHPHVLALPAVRREDATTRRPLHWTSTRDDRVHPAHARKMAARMLETGKDVRYFENTEGGPRRGRDQQTGGACLGVDVCVFVEGVEIGPIACGACNAFAVGELLFFAGPKKSNQKKGPSAQEHTFRGVVSRDFRTRHPWLDRKRRASCAPPSGS